MGYPLIRPFGEKDAVELRGIADSCWNMILSAYYDEKTIAHFEQYHEPERYVTLSKSDYSRIFVAEIDRSVVGFCLLGDLKNKARTGDVYQLFVDPDHRRKGIGTLLYNEAEMFAKGRGLVKLRCDSGIHPETISFWKNKCGFRSKGHMIRRYRDGFEAKVVYMEKVL